MTVVERPPAQCGLTFSNGLARFVRGFFFEWK
jgi:hypothetical protein